MVTIDPLEMRLRYTYDISRWMNMSEPITATFYDYRTHVYHFFFDQNGYRTWQVNVTFMNSLPMSWVSEREDRVALSVYTCRP